MTVVQDLARGSRTLQEASRAISSCCADGDLAQVRPDGRIYLVDATLSDETLVDLARAYTSETDDVDGELLGAINARVQQLRNGGDP